MKIIYVKSPKQGLKVAVGETDIPSRTAYFKVSQRQFFKEAEAIGADEKVFGRKDVKWCREYVFILWDRRRIKLTSKEFMDNSWVYPQKDNPLYKANSAVFAPKRVITFDKLVEILKSRPKKTEDDKLRQFCEQNH